MGWKNFDSRCRHQIAQVVITQIRKRNEYSVQAECRQHIFQYDSSYLLIKRNNNFLPTRTKVTSIFWRNTCHPDLWTELNWSSVHTEPNGLTHWGWVLHFDGTALQFFIIGCFRSLSSCSRALLWKMHYSWHVIHRMVLICEWGNLGVSSNFWC